MRITFSEDTDLERKRLECLQYLSRSRVDVGLTSTASGRSRFLMALHEHGAPGAHIPARPVIEPALADDTVRAEMVEGFLSAAAAAMEGEMDAVRSALESAGQAGADAIRGYIDAGVPPPNAPLTISGGWIRNFSSGKPVHISGKGFDKPLYDTGELYNDFDYEITDR